MGEKIIVVDDDPLVGDLTRYLLKDAGHEVELITESREAIAAIKEKRPALVLLDILMPGIDGLTLLHEIKNDPELIYLKVAMVSGKQFQPDRERALRFGADGFIDKPYHIETFSQKVQEILKNPGVARPAPPAQIQEKEAPPPPPAGKLMVTIWGCRSDGSGADAAPSQYGRRTPCVAVEINDRLFIFDAGTGLGDLGAELVKTGKHKEQWIFLTHFHPAHMAGLASYPCARAAGYTLHISGADDEAQTLQDAVSAAFQGADLAADVQLYAVGADPVDIMPGIRLTAFRANHPTNTLGFVLEADGRKFVYCPDNEIREEDDRLPALMTGADLVIHDARNLLEDGAPRGGSGHSSAMAAAQLAGCRGVKRLVLFHHDAFYSDEALDRGGQETKRLMTEKGYTLICVMGRDGLKFPI